MKLGKLPPKLDDRTLRLSTYLIPDQLPPIPLAHDWTRPVRKWSMLGNDEYGDCTIATAGHMIRAWTANDSKVVVLPDSRIIQTYLSLTGGGDTGLCVLDVLNYWRKTGIAGHKIEAFVKVDSLDNFRAACYLFGGVYCGFALPLAAQNMKVWYLNPGQSLTGDFAPGSWGGHAVPALAYGPWGDAVVTWGYEQYMTKAFFLAYCDEAYAVLSKDWLGEDGKAPHGFNYEALQADLTLLAK